MKFVKKFDLRLTDRQKYYFLIFPFSFFQVSNKYSQKSYSGFRKLKIFLIYTFLRITRRPFEKFLKYAQKCILFL